jgi:hypothetical protein
MDRAAKERLDKVQIECTAKQIVSPGTLYLMLTYVMISEVTLSKILNSHRAASVVESKSRRRSVLN